MWRAVLGVEVLEFWIEALELVCFFGFFLCWFWRWLLGSFLGCFLGCLLVSVLVGLWSGFLGRFLVRILACILCRFGYRHYQGFGGTGAGHGRDEGRREALGNVRRSGSHGGLAGDLPLEQGDGRGPGVEETQLRTAGGAKGVQVTVLWIACIFLIQWQTLSICCTLVIARQRVLVIKQIVSY